MSQPKLLIVDDEPHIVEFVQRIYQKKGYITFGATDGITAVDIYKKEQPDFSLIDVHMPFSEIDGIEVLRRIKAINKDAICIMVTRIYDRPVVEEARELGAAHYLPKPFDIEDLDWCIEDAKQKSAKKA